MKDQLEAASRHFRMGEIAAGSDVLIAFIDTFEKKLAEGAFAFDPAPLLRAVQHVVNAQEACDYLLVADLLEYELARVLG